MSEAPRRRPWFQLHLSTTVVLVLVAAAVLWLHLGVIRISSGLKLEGNTVTPFYSYRIGLARTEKVFLETKSHPWAAKFLASEAGKGKNWTVRYLYSLEDIPEEDHTRISAFLRYFNHDYIRAEHVARQSMVDNLMAARLSFKDWMVILGMTCGALLSTAVLSEWFIRRRRPQQAQGEGH